MVWVRKYPEICEPQVCPPGGPRSTILAPTWKTHVKGTHLFGGFEGKPGEQHNLLGGPRQKMRHPPYSPLWIIFLTQATHLTWESGRRAQAFLSLCRTRIETIQKRVRLVGDVLKQPLPDLEDLLLLRCHVGECPW